MYFKEFINLSLNPKTFNKSVIILKFSRALCFWLYLNEF